MQKIKLPFHSVQFQMTNHTEKLVSPILDNQVLWLNASPDLLAGGFANAYQDKVLDKGDYSSLVEYITAGNFEKKEIEVLFKAAKKQISFKELTVQFDYYTQAHERGFWCLIPSLAIEAFVEEQSDITAVVEEAIRLDFMRNNRLYLLQDVITTIWFESTQIQTNPLELKTYTPNEILALQEEKKKELLPKVAHQILMDKKVLWGYEKELNQLAEILKGNYTKNVLLVGKSGVGKTSLVWELISQRKKYKIKQSVWETTASTLIKELTGDIGWQENLTMLCKELHRRGDILFVRNLLELFEVGQYQGNSISMADFLRDFLSQGQITLISECSEEEYARIEARSPSYMSNFQIIQLNEPKEAAELERIILQKVQSIAAHQNIEIETEAIKETIRLNKRYTPYSGFPGKPIRFLESILIGSKALQKSLQKEAISYQLNRSAVIQSFCEETGMPPFMVDPQIAMNLEEVKGFFLKNVFGQNHAIDVLTNILAAVKTALLRQGKPIASMLFVGPTGVGKTEMAKVLAQFMFGHRNKMIRFDMSEYSTPYAVSRLTGSSYFSDGLLTSAIRREPFCVLLFDELEKAHPLFNDLLLQILGEGRLTDSQGKIVNFCSTIIIMTSNIGAKKAQNNSIAWVEDKDNQKVADHFSNEVRKFFRPEIYNRIDQIVPFYALGESVVKFVVQREIDLLQKREGLLHRNIDFYLSDNLINFLCQKGYNPKYGARALQRSLREQLIIPLAYRLNQYEYEDKLVINIDVKDQKLSINIVADPLKFDLVLEELTHNEYMEFASMLRQNIFKLFEGKFYVRMLSELDILERNKIRKSSQFWKDEKKSSQYTDYLALKNTFETHRDKIESHEQELALSSMGLTAINVQAYKDLEAWEVDYFKLKLELYQTLQPQCGSIYLGIYGKEVVRLLDIYATICEQKKYEWTARTVWFNEKEYHKMVEVEDEQGIKSRKICKNFIKNPYLPKDAKRWKPQEVNDVLIGIELKITGIGADLYFNEEQGQHQLITKNNTKFKYWVVVDNFDFEAPADIHRKSFFMNIQRPRRVIEVASLKDTVYKLPRRELKGKDLLPFLIKIMDKFFARKLDNLLF